MATDRMCAACGRWTHRLVSGSQKVYCDDQCKNRKGIPGKNQIIRELKEGEIVKNHHMFHEGLNINPEYYLYNKPYVKGNPFHKIYVIENK